MTDKDIAKLASKLTISLATKEDINNLKTELKGDIKELKGDIKRLEGKIEYLDQKADTILEFAEAVDETTTDLDLRVKRIESIPMIAHELRNPKS